MHTNKKLYNQAIPGILAGITSVTLGYPFETMKTNLQISPHKSINNTFKYIYRNKGLLGFFRGYPIPAISISIKRGYQYPLFEYLNSTFHPFLAGCIASCSGTIVGCPVNIIEITMQNTHSNIYKSSLNCVQDIYKKKGISGFYQGFKVNLLRDFIFGGTYLGIYGTLRNREKNNNYQSEWCFLYGGISSMLTWCIWYPIDVIKTNIQFTKNKITNLTDTQIYLQEYKFHIWKGITPILLRTVLISATSMYVYEKSKSLLNHNFDIKE